MEEKISAFFLLFEQIDTSSVKFYYLVALTSLRADPHYWRRMRVFSPVRRFETSRGRVCQGSGTNDY